MTHEPGRERYTTHKCEHCGRTAREDELTLTDEDEYWCESCINNVNEATYARQQERDLESPPESAREEQIRTWEEHQRAHKQ